MADYKITKLIRTDKSVKKNNKYPIYLKVRVFDKATKLPTSIEVEKNMWDFDKEEPKNKMLATLLNKKASELDIAINRALIDDAKLTIELVKYLYNGKKKEKPESTSFLEYYDNFIERKKNEGINKETIRVYRTTYNILEIFRPDLSISDINLKFIEDFDEYMRVKRGNANGGRNPKHKNLRSVILDMQKHDIEIKNPYPHFKIPQPNVKEVFLTEKELEMLKKFQFKFPRNSKLYNILNMYLFACYCGLRFSDVIRLKWSHIHLDKNMIVKEMKKTKKEVNAPIFKRTRLILLLLSENKTLLKSDNLVFKTYSEPTVNKTLGELAKIAGIDKHITFHSSRHTFATLLVIDGIDIYKIQKFLGHSSADQTQRYLKYNLDMAIESMKNITTFN